LALSNFPAAGISLGMPKNQQRDSSAASKEVLRGTSEAEEMYLITVAIAEEDGLKGPMPLASLAEALEVSPVSTNQMVWKLAERGLLTYHPYRGVLLTAAGRAVSNRVLRGRRLWTLFLVEHLAFSPTRADDLACRLEHVTPSDVADRLGHFLGDPKICPLGRHIPPGTAEAEVEGVASLLDLVAGASAEVVTVEAEPAVRSFLEREGIRPGASVRVEARGEADSVLVSTAHGQVHLGGEAARRVSVLPSHDEGAHAR
jgi:DtxR family Mn-dependent transcriptional regulator